MSRRRPLSRFTVLDLTRVRSGPNAVRQLADWGADVIKIESPAEDGMTGARDGSDFQALHRNKRSVVLDLKRPEGLATMHRLVRRADVLVENFRPDVKYRLGIDYDSLRSINPRLVYGSISGFGQHGPYSKRPGFDQIAQGMGGLMSINGEPGQGPLRVGVPIADICSGLFCALGILTALLDREVTGEGQWVQTSLLQAQVAMLDFQAAMWLQDRRRPTQTGNNHPTTAPMGVFPASDGNIVIGASNDDQYRRFCEAIDAAHLLDDPRFTTAETRCQNVAALTEAVSKVTRHGSMAAWVDTLNAAGIACGPIYTVDQMFEDAQVRALELVQAVDHRRLGTLDLLGPAYSLSGSDSRVRSASPEKGEHTDAVLAEFGFDVDEISALRSSGTVG